MIHKLAKKSVNNWHHLLAMQIPKIMGASGNQVLITIFVIFLIPFSHSVNFQLSQSGPDANTVILLEGVAEYSPGGIELINAEWFSVGHVIYNGKLPLWDSNSGKLADFTTHFSFTIDTQNSSSRGDGFAFFLAPVGFQIPPNSIGRFLGLFNSTTAVGSSQNQIVTVEFDLHQNSEWNDPPFEHVGINKNSIVSLVTAPLNATFPSGETADAWITYNATTKNLSVFWSYGGRPNSTLHQLIDLRKVLPQWVTVGFSASAGLQVEQYTLRSWEFNSSLETKEDSGNNGKKIGLVVGLSLSGCILIAIAAFVGWRKWKESVLHKNKLAEAANLTSMNDDLERGAGPRRFSYKDLALATNNFSDGRKLGEGGFGRVYKGHLLDLDLPIAVKKFSGESKQGKKQYITEVKIISMLRHRNLVRLIGWCHDEGEFLLVYEFMPNGSLDHHLFGKKNTLDWTLRYRIALGLASSLLYLHEEWEQCVIHRDIKSSNVMLDSSFNVKLGDFGLARLMDHGLDPQTTGLAGTFGYMAPEYVSTRRASKESDVYSFGVVALEIATGRKSIEPIDEESDKVLVEWIWDLYGKGQLVSAVDERLEKDFEPKQVECLMIVGLWCAHPDWSLRPSIRQASHVLNFEADLPQLARKMPVLMYQPPSNSSSSYQESSTISSSMNVGR